MQASMQLRILSDTHIEFGSYSIPVYVDESEQVLVLAGDIGDVENAIKFIEEVAPRFHSVVYVTGNHEYYYRNIEEVDSHLKFELSHLSNVHVLQNESVTIDGINFFGSTYWTECGGDDYRLNSIVQQGMNDFHVISWTDDELIRESSFSVGVCKEYNRLAKEYLEKFLQRHRGETNVVVTHHAPGELSVDEIYEGSPLNAGFHNDDNYKYCGEDISLWIHGHMHNSSDYTVNGTRVICNPAGYPSRNGDRKENPNLSETYVVYVEEN